MELNNHTELLAIQSEPLGHKIDPGKLSFVFKKSLFWLGTITFICFFTALMYVRYTKPLYESTSDIKLDKENQSEILGLNNINNNNSFGILSSEMELIKSRLFFNKIIESVRLNPQYFTYGNVLDDEKYRNPPFGVEYRLKSANMYNKPIDVSIADTQTFELSYEHNDVKTSGTYRFGERIETAEFTITVTLSETWQPSLGQDHYFIINSHDALLDYIEANLDVTPLNLEANTFQISFRDHNAFKSYDMVNSIDTLYYNYSLAEKNEANNKKIEYLDSQLKETERKLENLEDYFEEFTITNKTVDLDEDVKKTLAVINGLDSQRIELNQKVAHLRQLRSKIHSKSSVSISPDSRDYPPYLIKSIEELNLLLNEKDKLAISYRENTYTYKARQKEVELLKADIVVEVDELINSLTEEIRSLAGKKRRLTSLLLELPSKSTEFNKAKRFYSLNEEVYLSLMQSKNEFEIAVAGSTTKIKILSPASLSFQPISPKRVIAYGAAAVASMIFSFFFVGISYLMHNKLNSLSEVEKLTSASVLGSVPLYKGSNGHAELIVSKKPKSIVSEALRSIRTNIEFMLPAAGSKIYSITSTVGAEGKTFVSTNLGALIAMTGKKIVILDLDLRKPKVHLAFDQDPSAYGLSTLLIGKHKLTECIRQTKVENLDYIAAGPIPPNPSELLLRPSFDELLNNLKQSYDVIILDTPPVGLVTDGLLAMKKADLPIYILKANYSHKSFVENINRLIKSGQFTNLSIIFNGSSNSQLGYSHKYGYNSKSSYYEV